MAKEKSLVEEAILSMKNLEEAVAENAKGILASTMKEEIKELVKESLSEQEEDEIENDAEIEMPQTGEETDDESEGPLGMDMDIEADNEEESDDESIDLTKKSDEEVLRVFKLMGPDDHIVITKDDSGNISLKDNETEKEYMIVGESQEDLYGDSELEEEDSNVEGIIADLFDKNEEEDNESAMYEMSDMDDESEDDESEDDTEIDYGLDIPDDMPSYKTKWKYSDDEEEDDESVVYEIEVEEDDSTDEEDDSVVYEIEMDEEQDKEEEEESYLEESMKKTKAKGMGMGKSSKFKYGNKINQSGFKTKMKQGPKSVGTGKPKFAYDKSGENLDGEFKIKPKGTKKGETTEAARTLGNGRDFRKGGLPKRRAHSSSNINIEEGYNAKEVQILREKNEEYRKALNVFRSKLNEVAVFNSNLAYATRLFTEHSTSKQEKINILRRFDGVETLKESKNLYKIIKDELSGNQTKPINESIEKVIEKAPSNGSSVSLIESKTYENPQFLRMKDLMAKIK